MNSIRLSVIGAALLVSLTACAATSKPQAQAASCQPAPCVLLNRNDLDLLGPWLVAQRDAIAKQKEAVTRQYDAADGLIKNMQDQVNKQMAAPAPAK